MDKIKGYQVLEQEFFNLCNKRKIKGNTILLFIYLRGLYCRLGKPDFYYPDSILSKTLSMAHDTLLRGREKLQERGLIEYKSSKGKGRSIEYFMLKTELLPELKLRKKRIHTTQNAYYYNKNLSTITTQKAYPIVIESKEESKRLTDQQHQELHNHLQTCIKNLSTGASRQRL